jgi:hypothetical protein
MSRGAQNMKTGHVAPGSTENESEIAKHEKKDPPLPVLTKTCPGAQKKKSGPNDLGTVENGTCRPQYRRKTSPGTQNMKMGLDTLGIAGNNSGSSNH